MDAAKDRPMLVLVDGDDRAKIYDDGELIADAYAVDGENAMYKTTLANERMSWYWPSLDAAINGIKNALEIIYSDEIKYAVYDCTRQYADIRVLRQVTSDYVVDLAIEVYDALAPKIFSFDVSADGENIELKNKVDDLNWTDVIIKTDGFIELNVFRNNMLGIKAYRGVDEFREQDLI